MTELELLWITNILSAPFPSRVARLFTGYSTMLKRVLPEPLSEYCQESGDAYEGTGCYLAGVKSIMRVRLI